MPYCSLRLRLASRLFCFIKSVEIDAGRDHAYRDVDAIGNEDALCLLGWSDHDVRRIAETATLSTDIPVDKFLPEPALSCAQLIIYPVFIERVKRMDMGRSFFFAMRRPKLPIPNSV